MSWKRTLGILWVANFCVAAGWSLVMPFLPLYIESLGVHQLPEITRWSGWVYSATFVTAIFFQPVWGRVADRYGRKIMLLGSGLGMGLSTALMGAAGSVWHLLFLRLLNGVFSGFIPMAISLQASVTPTEHSGKALGTLQTGTVAGALIGPLLGGVMAGAFGYRPVFFLTGGLLIMASIVVLLFVREKRRPAESVVEAEPAGLKDLRPLLPVFIATTVTQIGMMSINPIVTLYVKELYTGAHLAFMAGLVVAVTGVANLIGAPVLGGLGDRIGQRRVLMLALSAAALMYIPQALAGSVGVLLVGRFLLGLFIGGMIPTLNVLVKLKAPAQLQATAFGFNTSFMFVGNLVGPIMGSSLAAAFGFRTVFYAMIPVFLANVALVGLHKGFKAETSAPAPVPQSRHGTG